MFNNIKITLRNLHRNGLYSWINIAGLAVSLTAVILIMLWVHDELSFDRFHKRDKDIYHALSFYENWGYSNSTTLGLAVAGMNEIPEIENACRRYRGGFVSFLKNDENILTEVRSTMVESSFFSIFDFTVKEGNLHDLLPNESSIVLSESAAKILFGNEQAIGKFIEDNSNRRFNVTGIIADMPQNSSFHYNVLFAFSLHASDFGDSQQSLWDNASFETYFLMKPGADIKAVAQKLTAIHKRYDNEFEDSYALFPLIKKNLYNLDGTPNAKLQACRLFSIAVGILLLISCINYVNLVTSRASRKNKEIFIRNVFGARKTNLFFHFLKESLLLFFCSIIVATALIYILFPVFNQITDKQLEFRLFSASTTVIYGLAFAVTTLFAGIYPALKLSYGNSVNKMTSGANTLIRRGLVVMQFTASVILILAAITVNRQLHFIKTMNAGYDGERVFRVGNMRGMNNYRNDVKTLLLQNPAVEGVTLLSGRFNDVNNSFTLFDWEGREDNNHTVSFSVLHVDADFIPMLNVKILEGSNFTGTRDDEAHFIVNRTTVDAMRMQNPVGKQLYINNWGKNGGQIIGVVDDFHFQNIYEPVKPLVICVTPWAQQTMYVKAGAHSVNDAIKAVESMYSQYESEFPFEYSFIDDEYARMYKNDIRAGNLFNIFSIIAILISCLGLFGLVTYIAETKTKEIGVRKVLGASVNDIITMLSKEFFILTGISLLIAFPAAYYLLELLLQDYAYRIETSWWMFAQAGVITVVLTMISVGWQAFRAARANPVKALKSE